MSINFLSHIYHLFFFSLISRLIPKGIYCRTMDRLMEVLKWVYMALFFFFVILQLDNFLNPATLNLYLDKRFVETLPIRQTLIHRVDTPCQKEDSTVTKKLSASRAKTYVMKCSISLFCLKSLVNMFFLFIRLPIHLRCSALVQENRGAEVDLRFVSLFAGSHFMLIYSELS